MKTIDYACYLNNDDIRTPTDAIFEMIRISDCEDYSHAQGKVIRSACYTMLRRIDRERRKAYRRGALDSWRKLRWWIAFNTAKQPGYDWSHCYYAIQSTLAFRDAAKNS